MEAVVSHTEGSVGTVLVKLGSLLAQEAVKLYYVSDDIQELKDELESMNAFIENIAKTEDHDKQVKTWMKQVRETAYDIEDCIDEFMHRLGRPIEGNWFHPYFRRGVRLLRTLKARCEIAYKIQSLKTRIHSVSERHSRYAHLVPTPESSGSIDSSMGPRLSTLFSKESEVVGIEDCRKKVVQLLMDKNVPDLRVISIVGYGGLGKTTLAMAAYENTRVNSDHFQFGEQISMSQKFNPNVLLRYILKKVFPSRPEDQNTGKRKTGGRNPLENIESWNTYKLVNKLKDYLEKIIYIIVVDDVWTESDWNTIKYAFPNSKNGSRIIVTTRINSVAESCSSSTHDYVYKIEPLSEKESQDLFFKKVFGHSNGCPSELKNVSEGVLKKCGGMPLAIVSIAGLLSVKTNKSEQEWQKVLS